MPFAKPGTDLPIPKGLLDSGFELKVVSLHGLDSDAMIGLRSPQLVTVGGPCSVQRVDPGEPCQENFIYAAWRYPTRVDLGCKVAIAAPTEKCPIDRHVIGIYFDKDRVVCDVASHSNPVVITVPKEGTKTNLLSVKFTNVTPEGLEYTINADTSPKGGAMEMTAEQYLRELALKQGLPETATYEQVTAKMFGLRDTASLEEIVEHIRSQRTKELGISPDSTWREINDFASSK